jgi:hypothetical protein
MNELEQFIKKFGKVTEEYTFYNGSITLRYDVKDHVYLLVLPDGTLEVQDGVTNICHIMDKSNVLIPWGCKMMAQKLKVSLEPFLERVHYVGGSIFVGKYEITEPDFDELLRKSKSAHKDKLEDAGEVGHTAHGWIEQYIKQQITTRNTLRTVGDPYPAEERASNCCQASLSWMARHNVRWLGTERKIYSRTFKYAGTMDGLARVDSCNDTKCCKQPFKDHLAIIDWKTSNYLYVEYLLQTAAYRQAYQEETGEQVEDIFIIRLGKDDGKFEAWHVQEELASLAWSAFLRALWLSRAMAEVNELVDEEKDERKALKKAEKQEQKQAQLAIKCGYADKYKGVRRPTCGCQTCELKYEEVQKTRVTKVAKEKGFKPVPEAEQDKRVFAETHSVLASLRKLLDE